MIDRTRTGQRVRVIHPVRTAARLLDRNVLGRVVYEILEETTGKHLIEVEWEDQPGQTCPVFVTEVEFML